MKRILFGYLSVLLCLLVFNFSSYAQETVVEPEGDSKPEIICEHIFTQYISDNNATYFIDGTKTAVCDNGCGETDSITDEGTVLVLNKPKKIIAKISTSSIRLTWNKVKGASGYRVYYKTTGKWKTAAAFTQSNTFELKNLKPGLKVHFAVKSCVIEDEKKLFSSDYAYLYTSTKNAAPKKIVSEQTTSEIKLTWKACSGADGYRVFYRNKNGSWKVCTKDIKGTTVTYKNLPAGHTYTFAVRPYLKAGTVVWGNYAEYTTATLPKTTDVKINLVSKGKINVTWDKIGGADGYQVFYKINNGKYKFYKAYTSVKKLNFTLKGDKNYTFAVRGFKKISGGYVYGKHKNETVHIGKTFDRIVVDLNSGKWNLHLVNKEREMSDNYTIKLADIPGDCQLDYRVAPYFNKMYSDALKEGVYLTPLSGYRSKDLQLELYNERIVEYKYYGYSETQAELLTSKEILPPGTSEHNLGLAVDIGSLSEYFADSAAYKWLTKNAHKYGFIERYTAEKQSITGIIPEAWHWRYVGVEYAEKIKNSGLCLEEYLGKNKLIP